MQYSNSTEAVSITVVSFLPVIVVSLGLIALLLCFGVCRHNKYKGHLTAWPRYLRISVLSGSLLQLTFLIVVSCALLKDIQTGFDNAFAVSLVVRLGTCGICIGYSSVFVSLLLESWRQSNKSYLKKLKDEHLLIILGMLLIVEVLVLSFWLISLNTTGEAKQQHSLYWWVLSQPAGHFKSVITLAGDTTYWVTGIVIYKICLATMLLYKSLLVPIKSRNRNNVVQSAIILSSSALTGFSASLPGILLVSSPDGLFIMLCVIVITPNVIITATHITTKICCVFVFDFSSNDEGKLAPLPKAQDDQLLLQIENKLLIQTIAENKKTIRSLKSRLDRLEVKPKTMTLSTSTLHVLRKEKQVWSAPSLLSRKCASDTMLQKNYESQETSNLDALKSDGGGQENKFFNYSELKNARYRGVIDCGVGCYYVTDYSSSSDSETEWERFADNNATRFQQHVKIIQSVYEQGLSEVHNRRSTRGIPIRTANLSPNIYRTSCDFLSDSDSSYSDDYPDVRAKSSQKSETLV